MIDLHAHVLPGVDDGARDLDEAITMLQMAAADGIRTIVSTPHFDGRDIDLLSRAAAALRLVRQRVDASGLDIRVLAGFELALTPELLRAPADWATLGLNGSRYLLVECPVAFWSSHVEDGLFQLQSAGLRPLLAHAERYDPILKDFGFAARLVERGILLQVNADSLTGARGREHAQCARALITRGLVSVLATDSHSPRSRAPHLRAAARLATRLIGVSAAEALVSGNPSAVLHDQELPEMPPIRRSSFVSAMSRSLNPRRQLLPEQNGALPPTSSPTMKSQG